jgi:hypothetical protein
MIIGIFGDSFASEEWHPNGWSCCLRTQYQYNIQNFSASATSLFWSYQQLIKNIDNFDTIIFVATSPGRLYWPNTARNLHYISSMFTAQQAIKSNPPINDLAVFKAAEQYHLNLANDEFDVFVHNQILKEISKLCTDRGKKLIMIPAFDINIPCQSVFQCSLMDVTMTELATQFGTNRQWLSEKNTRYNHLSAANNIILAETVDKLLHNAVLSVGLDNFVYEQVANPELYWDI